MEKKEKGVVVYDHEFINKFESFVLNFQEKIDDTSKKLYKSDNELRIVKEMLFQNSKMALMGEMIDSIIHQWKQPLGIISLKSLYLGEFISEKEIIEKKDLQKISSDINIQIKHMVDTMEEFKNFFRPNYNIEILDFEKILYSISILLQDELKSKRVELEIIKDDNCFLKANQNDIKHLLICLINNAKEEIVNSNIDNKKRKIIIEYKKLNNDSLEILVKDNGKGVSKDIKKEIFKPHFSTKKDNGGTGIGLYICKQIVQKYSGKISVHNDNGAVFKVVLNN